jgi:hypothetical protein
MVKAMSIIEYLSNSYFIGGICIGLTLYLLLYIGSFEILCVFIGKITGER